MLYTIFGSYLLYCALLQNYVEGSSKPNIIFIMADDLGYNDIGYNAKNHNSDMKTPFLDAMAERGIKLENYYVQPRCTPSRSQLLTGRQDISTGLHHAVIYTAQPNGVPTTLKMLPEQLRDCGYDTHMVGKWHLGFYKNEFLPSRRGFNSYFGDLTGASDHFTHTACSKQSCGVSMWSSSDGPVNNTWGEYSAHLYARKAIEVIKKRDIMKPFFLYLSYQSVHSPIQAPDEYIKPFSHISNKKRRTYAGMVLAMDESIRNVTSYLHKVGLLENTIVVFSTDNGGITRQGGNNYPYKGGKASLHEGGVKAVGFIYGKPLGMRNVTHNGLLHVSDWYPTFLRLSSCPKMEGTQPLDGFDQFDSIVKKTSSPRYEILHGFDPLYKKVAKTTRYSSQTVYNTEIRAALRCGPWKLITGHPGSNRAERPPEYNQRFGIARLKKGRSDRPIFLRDVQLYHIESDPTEKIELSDKYPKVVYRLLNRLANYTAKAIPVRFPRADRRSDTDLHGGYWVPWRSK
uniref:arylsulfatase J-like n=1 Tax=Styela clava TaxID=7725 RepID=UPI00193939C2|nr:arylsulfatase J-like [Styela clava]